MRGAVFVSTCVSSLKWGQVGTANDEVGSVARERPKMNSVNDMRTSPPVPIINGHQLSVNVSIVTNYLHPYMYYVGLRRGYGETHGLSHRFSFTSEPCIWQRKPLYPPPPPRLQHHPTGGKVSGPSPQKNF